MVTKKAAKRGRDDIGDLMEEDAAVGPSEDKLTRVRNLIAELRGYEVQKSEFEERAHNLSEKIKTLKEKTIVDAFDDAKITNLGIEAEGNLPAYDIELKNYYHANIPDDENAGKAYDWLRKNHGGDMIKATYTIQFGRGSEKKQKEFEAYLKKQKIAFNYKFGVPWATLTSFVRERLEANVALPLKLLGAKTGRVASLKKQKKGK
jgi:hypothetical protein